MSPVECVDGWHHRDTLRDHSYCGYAIANGWASPGALVPVVDVPETSVDGSVETLWPNAVIGEHCVTK